MIRIKLIGFAVSLLTLVTFSSCFDEPEDPDDQFRDETRAIDAYINENGLNAMEDRTTELRYVINNPGDSIAPYTFDSVLVSYTLKLLSTDEVVLTETNRKIKLDDQIPGWQFLLPYLKRGGDMLMFIPSQYGFGDVKITGINGGAEIPRNSTLLYEVELHEVYHLNEVEQRRYEQKRIDAFLENANDTTAMLDPLSRIKYITYV